MKRYKFHPVTNIDGDFSAVKFGAEFYLASDVDHELSQMASAVECKGNEIVGLKARVMELEKALIAAKRPHHRCSEDWYSCPLSEDGPNTSWPGGECNCGASQHNEKIDAVLNRSL